MHTVFRVGEIKQTTENSRLWEVQLTITDESDPQLAGLTDRIKEEIDGRGWQRMGKLMLQVGHFDQAEELYNELLENASDDKDAPSLAPTYGNIGAVYYNMGEYSKALEYYEKAHKIYEISLPPTPPDLATSYNNIGQLYKEMEEYSKALQN
ncbi:unnamed protein product, partial [Rotaria socialis]